MSATIQFIQVSPEQLQSEITKGVKAHLDEFLKHFKPKQILMIYTVTFV